MDILIIEDELPAARRLAKLILQCDDQINILDTIQSVKAGIEWFDTHKIPDLVLSDIQLSDDLSFEIFKKLNQHVPIIFTTAFDEYAIKAFEYYSIDYLLKPIKEDLLCRALEKFKTVYKKTNSPALNFEEIIEKLNKKDYKKRFLVFKGNALLPVEVDEVSYIFSDNGSTFLVLKNNTRFILQETLDNLENTLDPEHFYRANRQIIVSLHSIKKIHQHFNQRLKLEVQPTYDKELYISKLKATEFKNWLDS